MKDLSDRFALSEDAPKVEARLLQELAVQRHERVLEVGAGSGYMAALLAHRGRSVTSVEISPELAKLAADNQNSSQFPRIRRAIT